MRDLLRVKQTKKGENRGEGLHARDEIADGGVVHTLRDFHPELLLEVLNAVLGVPEIERRVEIRERAAAQIANELSAEQIEAQRTRERFVVLELDGKRLAGALERTVRGDAGDVGVEDVHEGKDLGRELGNDFTEITPVLRVRERGEDVRNVLWYRAASTRKRRIRLPTCRELETRTLVSASG